MSGLDGAKQIGVGSSFRQAASGKPVGKQAAPFSIRLTVKERSVLERRARGLSLGAYIRKALLGDAAEPRGSRQRRPTLDRVALAKALAALGQSRLASNMNQIAKAAHTGTLLLDPELVADLIAACADIQLMRDELMRALRTGAEGPE